MADETKKAPKEKKPQADKPKAEKPVKAEKADKAPAAAAAPATGEAPAKDAAKPAEVMAGAAPTAAELLGEGAEQKKIIKAKHAKNISAGIANILATFNNTLVS